MGCQFDHIIITINTIIIRVLIVDAHMHAYYNHNEL